MNDDIIDKQLIHIDSSSATINGTYNSSTTQDFYIDILEPLKNALSISILKANIILNPLATLNGNVINDLDPIYIDLNGYHRITTNINKSLVNYFELIPLNLTEKYPLIYIQGTNNVPFVYAFSNNYQSSGLISDSHTFILNPVDPNLKRFNIKLYDKNNKIINKSDITRFTMTLCVYINRKKLTMD